MPYGYYPYIAGLVTYLILLFLKKSGRLKQFDKYMWSPFVVGFSVVCVLWITIDSIWDSGFDIFEAMLENIFVFFLLSIILSQILWFSIALQIMAIYSKNETRAKIYLRIAQVFTGIGVVIPVISNNSYSLM